MAKNCKDCGKHLGFFASMFGDCYECNTKKRIAAEAAAVAAREKRWAEKTENWPWRIFSQSAPPVSIEQKREQKTPVREDSWVEVLLMISWIFSFCAAVIFAFMAVAAANDYEPGTAIVFTAYAISLTVSGVIFASIGKIISILSLVNDNLSAILSKSTRDVEQPQEPSEITKISGTVD
jgi:hypothetical protein